MFSGSDIEQPGGRQCDRRGWPVGHQVDKGAVTSGLFLEASDVSGRYG